MKSRCGWLRKNRVKLLFIFIIIIIFYSNVTGNVIIVQ